MLLAMCVALLALPAAASAQAPVNDNYLDSLGLNERGKPLERKDTLSDKRDTTLATVQGDIFTPPKGGGGPERTRCKTTDYGKTVWYDFYPDVNGLVRLRANGFDSVITVVPFNFTTALPNFPGSLCLNDSASTTEEYLVHVRKGRSYTVQIGGVNNAGGNLEFLFDFLADTDGDGVLDDADNCPRLKGTGGKGCPVRLRPDITLTARGTAAGVEIVKLKVKSSRKVRIEVKCRACPKQVKRGKRVSFGRLGGQDLSAGTKLEIRVTRKGAIGSYTAYKIGVGSFDKLTRCMKPGSTRPRRRCT
jgi:hypothetical protein